MRSAFIFLLVLAGPLFSMETGFVPHIADVNGNFSTSLVLENRHESHQTVTFDAYDKFGNLLEIKGVSLNGNTRATLNVLELFDIAPSHLEYTAPERVSVAVQYTPKANPDNRATIQGIADSSEVWRIQAGNWENTYDAVAVVNTSCGGPATVRLVQYDKQGSLIDEKVLTHGLQNRGKVLANLPDYFQPLNGSYVEIQGSSPLAVLALKGTRDPNARESFLIGYQAVPLPLYEALLTQVIANRQLWSDSGFAENYRFTYQNLCFCGGDFARPVDISVVNDTLVEMVFNDDHTPVPLHQVKRFNTVAELFDLIVTVAGNQPDGLRVVFDKNLGYPAMIEINWSACVADDEFSIHVTEVQSLK